MSQSPTVAAYACEAPVDRSEQEGTSSLDLDGQKQEMWTWASQHDVGPLRIYEDAVREEGSARSIGEEGAAAGRPGLRRLLSDVEDGQIRAILVYRANRLSDALSGVMKLVEDRLEPEGVRLVSMTEPLDTATETGQGILRMLRSFSVLERDAAAEGRRRKAKRGGHASGEIPYGYQKAEGGGLEPDPDEAPVIRRIFALRDEGESLRSIAEVLNEEEVPTKRGRCWHASTIKNVLDNPKYRGRIRQSIGDATVEVESERLRIVG